MFLNQSAGGAVPNDNAAIFKFLNPNGDPIARRIGLGDAFAGEPVELAPGETVYATLGWFMFVVDKCKSQTVRAIVDFDSPQCQLPDPEENDPETLLDAIAALPEECLGPREQACNVYDGDLRFDFGSSVPQARRTVTQEITQEFQLDGAELPVGDEAVTFFKYVSGSDPEGAPRAVCSEDLHNSPIYAYFTYGYQIPPQTGKCMSRVSGALIQGLAPGEHEFQFVSTVGGQAEEFPPLTLIQH